MGFQTVMNRAGRSLATMFPGFAGASFTPKHDYNKDFGFPDHLAFGDYHRMYRRNGVAAAGVDKTVLKTWQTAPLVQEDDDADVLTQLEADVKKRFATLRLWQRVAEADRRSLVGEYAALIFRVADDRAMHQPVEGVRGGLDGLVEIIPAWQGQLTVASFDTDERSPAYGHPKMFSFQEAAVETNAAGQSQPRNFQVHPDRVLVWSRDGTVFGQSALEPGFNDLITVAKIIGAGGEGFWKNAKAAPVLSLEKDAQLATMAQAMGVPVDEIADKIDDQVKDYNAGFDASLLLQNMTADTLNISLPQPEEFVTAAMQSFAASMGIPIKILIGMQTGERASTEDAKEWAQTCMARRDDHVIPNIMALIDRLVSFGILPAKNWSLHWPDLTESSMSEKIDRADKMAAVNLKHSQAGSIDVVFTDDEIRDAVGMRALTDAEKFRDEESEGDDDDPND